MTGKCLYYDYNLLPYTPQPVPAGGVTLTSTEGEAQLDGIRHNLSLQSARTAKFSADLDNANNSTELVNALSNSSMLTGDNSVDKAMTVLKDPGFSAGERSLALSRLMTKISTDESDITYLLTTLNDTKNPPEFRESVLRAIKTLSFSSPIFSAVKPQVVQALHGLVNDPVMRLREDAVSYLAKDKDEFVQRELIKGIEKPDQAIVPEELAIHLLGYDLHAGIFSVLRNVVIKSGNLDSRAEALHLLGNDPGSKDLLLQVFNNKKERYDIRKNSLLSLRQQDPKTFVNLAQRTVLDNNESENIRVLSINALEHTNTEGAKQGGQFLRLLKVTALASLPRAVATGISSYIKQKDKDSL